jgi:hypothetical protein
VRICDGCARYLERHDLLTRRLLAGAGGALDGVLEEGLASARRVEEVMDRLRSGPPPEWLVRGEPEAPAAARPGRGAFMSSLRPAAAVLVAALLLAALLSPGARDGADPLPLSARDGGAAGSPAAASRLVSLPLAHAGGVSPASGEDLWWLVDREALDALEASALEVSAVLYGLRVHGAHAPFAAGRQLQGSWTPEVAVRVVLGKSAEVVVGEGYLLVPRAWIHAAGAGSIYEVSRVVGLEGGAGGRRVEEERLRERFAVSERLYGLLFDPLEAPRRFAAPASLPVLPAAGGVLERAGILRADAPAAAAASRLAPAPRSSFERLFSPTVPWY